MFQTFRELGQNSSVAACEVFNQKKFINIANSYQYYKYSVFIFSAFYFIISDTWKDNPDFTLYLAELSASSVEKLSKI